MLCCFYKCLYLSNSTLIWNFILNLIKFHTEICILTFLKNIPQILHFFTYHSQNKNKTKKPKQNIIKGGGRAYFHISFHSQNFQKSKIQTMTKFQPAHPAKRWIWICLLWNMICKTFMSIPNLTYESPFALQGSMFIDLFAHPHTESQQQSWTLNIMLGWVFSHLIWWDFCSLWRKIRMI